MSRRVSTPGDLDWRVSRACEGGQCIKVARNGEFVLIGNADKSADPGIAFTVDEWRRFLIGAKLGDFDGIA